MMAMAEGSFHLHNTNPKTEKKEFPSIALFWSAPRRSSFSSSPSSSTLPSSSPPPNPQGRIVCSLNSALLRSSSPFPYFFLLSLEAGSLLRSFLLLSLFPLALLLSLFNTLTRASDDLSLRFLIFISTAGIRFSEIQGVSKAVLTKFFLDDLHRQTFKILTNATTTTSTDSSTCRMNKIYVVTSYPRVMVEYFLKEHVGVDDVFGTELQVNRHGVCTGLVQKPAGILTGKKKVEALRKVFTNGDIPDVALGSGDSDYPFMSWSKEAFLVDVEAAKPVPREQYRKPLVFHDGRLVQRPVPIAALAMFLWLPAGVILALVRLLILECLPMELVAPLIALSGLNFRVKGAPPLPLPGSSKQQGILFVSSHRSLIDPLVAYGGLRRKVRGLSYSASPFSEFISPVKLVNLTRNRDQDKRLMGGLLARGEDLFLTPEGTTGREPYLLRFSALFAELTDEIVPVGMKLRVSMFHGTSARGFKALDALFMVMNPWLAYEMVILERLPRDETVGGGAKTGFEVASIVQKKVADALGGFTCTQLTRRDKYMALAGNDGTVPAAVVKTARGGGGSRK